MSILASLVKAYDRLERQGMVPPFGFSSEKIGFVISLNEDGSAASVIDLRSGEGKKKTPRMMEVPASFKRPGTVPKPFFLWDNTAFALGVSGAEGKNAETRRVAFRNFHLDVLGKTDDPGLKALRLFVESWTPDMFAEPFWPDEMKDQNVVFALEGERRQYVYLHDRPAAKALWAQMNTSNDGPPQICLVSGARGPVARLHPAIKGVWGAQSSGASIISFNLDAFASYGHTQGDNAPVSELAASKYTAALNALLGSSNHRLQIGDASTVFWADASDAETAAEAESTFLAMFNEVDEESEAQRIGDILMRMRKGVPLKEIAPKLTQGVRFYVLGLAPNAARLSIRFWFEDDFGRLAENYQRFVADMAVDPPPRDEHPALWKYLSETAVLGKRENVPPNLAGEWMRAILAGTPYPLTLLSTVLMRIRADKQVNALRAGLLKAVLIRNFNKAKEAPVSLDSGNTNRGYLLGRLFAAYEQAQTAALGRNVNATIKDKFYGTASAQPRRVFPLLDKGAANHLSKVGKQKPGLKVILERTLSTILEAMNPDDDPFPASLNAQEQALFSLGYYHQRNEFFRKPETAETEEAAL
jgi:CRISPR-associated protein Csd1